MPPPSSPRVRFTASLAGLALSACTVAPEDELFTGTARNRMDASERTTCWIVGAGALRCNGARLRGTSSPDDGEFVKVSVGGDMACGLRGDGTLRCFLANMRKDLQGEFVDVDVETTGVLILALHADGRLSRWDVDPRTGNFRVLGRQTDGASAATPYRRIVATSFQACGLDASGRLSCWEMPDDTHRFEPEGTFVELSAGQTHICARSAPEEESVICWGGNVNGQAADARGRFSAISAGADATCALAESGDAECWGDGSSESVVAPGGPFVAVAAGGGHRCALRASGEIACWGFGAGLPAAGSRSDTEGSLGEALDSCARTSPDPAERFACELDRGYLSTLGLAKVNQAAFVQQFGSTKLRNIWVSGEASELPDGGTYDIAAIYGAIDPDNDTSELVAPIPVGARLVHENPGGDRYELMTKLPDGAAPDSGDWSFSQHLLDGTRVSPQSGGSGYGDTAPPTCLDCHDTQGRRVRTDLLWGVPRSAMP